MLTLQTTKISFGTDFALKEKLPQIVRETKRKIAVITDTTVKQLYASSLPDLPVFSFPAGEEFKTRESKAKLEDQLLSHQFGRDSLLIALGGGVVCDLVGFLASTYCRGVPVLYIPTTLLAMVDAAIGGKTGVNTPEGKNMIGTFYPAQEVIIDDLFLSSLPPKELVNGLVEISKYGLIASPSLFKAMQELPFSLDWIRESVAIKQQIVEQDPYEQKGIRRVLNLGHTVGHALEQLEHYQMAHGQAVAIGILVSGYMSVLMGLLSEEDFASIFALFQFYELPLQISRKYSCEEVLRRLSLDKKASKGVPRMVLLDAIGSVHPFGGEYCTVLPPSLWIEAIDWMNTQFFRA